MTPQDEQDEKDTTTAKAKAAAAASSSTGSTANDDAPETPEGVATREENADLEHTDADAPETTRDDGTDAGVPMLQGQPDEPVGPEDALGKGPTRGDYRTRVGDNHAESVPLEDGGEPILDDDGNVADYKPRFALEDQVARTEDIGDAPGLKGGVDTATQ